jgi:HYR domain
MPRSSALIKHVSALAVTAGGLLLASGSASAAVPDAPWSGSGTAVTTVKSDGTTDQPQFEYAVPGQKGAWTFSAVSKSARRQPVVWRYTGFHAWFLVRVAIERFVTRGGKEIVTEPLASAGPATCCAAPSGGFTFQGSTTFDLQTGDVYGFRMSGSHSDADRRLNGLLSLSVPDVTPPTVTPTVTGRLGKGGYHTSDVDVAWTVADDESGVTKRDGCDDVKVTADTAGKTFTCTGVSQAGETTKSVTIKRDTAAPALTVPPTVVKDGAGAGGAAVDFAPTATDVIDPSPAIHCAPASGTVFPLGATRVSCNATDAAGHTSAKDFEVLVLRGDAAQASNQLQPALTYRYRVRKRITRLKKLGVKNLRVGSTVSITCKGPTCPKPVNRKTVTRRAATTRLDLSALVKGPLKAGMVVTVKISAPDGTSAIRKLTMRKAKPPRLS